MRNWLDKIDELCGGFDKSTVFLSFTYITIKGCDIEIGVNSNQYGAIRKELNDYVANGTYLTSRFPNGLPLNVFVFRKMGYTFLVKDVTVADVFVKETCEVCGTEPAGECDHPKNGYCAKYQKPNK